VIRAGGTKQVEDAKCFAPGVVVGETSYTSAQEQQLTSTSDARFMLPYRIRTIWNFPFAWNIWGQSKVRPPITDRPACVQEQQRITGMGG
jgi:hypothetical protein